ncbi:MAG: excinuclease ABC subunit UvrA, partial [Gemmataceae bacterium]
LAPAEGGLEKALNQTQALIAEEVLKEIRGRVKFLLDVGLDYLTLERQAPTLSGGEAQRIRLASQIGCGLVGVLYILDEPSIGLHPRDNERLIKSLLRLKEMGNTVIVVEHDEDTLLAADLVVDFGPGPGVLGGRVVAAGDLEKVKSCPESVTGNYLAGTRSIPVPSHRRKGPGKNLRIVGARHHNLRGIDVDFPLGLMVCVTGASGSGKSSLVNDILAPGVRALLKGGPEIEDTGEEVLPADRIGDHDRIEGVGDLSRLICIDQAPIGRTPRSNPATYIKVFDEIRALFALMPEAKTRGFGPGRFSFNRPGGRCESCEGNGSTRLEMDFLADVWVKCPVCDGLRFNHETLQVKHRGKNIQEVLDMDVSTALGHFESVPKIRGMLDTLRAVGLDYIKLGQSAPTLSGGEAQRVKLAKELCKRGDGGSLYILDEPTTGLHFEDVRKLLEVLHGFVDKGNTVVVIEHNLDVVKTADWVIDLGPEGGARGGSLIVAGTPEEVAACPDSHTGVALAKVLKRTGRYLSGNASKKRVPGAKSPKAGQGLIREITVQGASQHNLRHVSLEIPRGKSTVFCGPSGSGKTSLAIDTIYAEGQRRYVESLSSYARQFLGQVEKPKVEQITGLSPAICIEQKTASKSPRSTVGTVTEIHDYLRVLYARLGTPFCVDCGVPVGAQSADEIIGRVQGLPEGTRVYLLAPVQRRAQESFVDLLEGLRRDGYARVRVDGVSQELDKIAALDHRRKITLEVVVDRLVVKSGQRTRLADGVEKALSLGKGVMRVACVDTERDERDWQVETYSRLLSCQTCGRGYERLEPHHFSFNSPLGWCPSCEGLGVQRGTQATLVIRDGNLSLRSGALAGWPSLAEGAPFAEIASSLVSYGRAGLEQSWESLGDSTKKLILHGAGESQWFPLTEAGQRPGYEVRYRGIFPALQEAAKTSPALRERLESLVGEVPCSGCGGARIRPESGAFHLRFEAGGAPMTLARFQSLSLEDSLGKIKAFDFSGNRNAVASELVREVRDRLGFLVEVGLGYLTLDRSTPTLSGGEAQRIRLASQIGSGLTGVLYVLDEPTIGLHPRDNRRLLAALDKLRDLGNTLLMVEHEREVLE